MRVKDITDTTIKEDDLIKVDICKDMIFIVKKDPTHACTGCCFSNIKDKYNPLYRVCRTRIIYCQGNRIGKDSYIFKIFSGV